MLGKEKDGQGGWSVLRRGYKRKSGGWAGLSQAAPQACEAAWWVLGTKGFRILFISRSCVFEIFP